MYTILVVAYKNGVVDYYGPFKEHKAATDYMKKLQTPRDKAHITRWFTAPLIVPDKSNRLARDLTKDDQS